VAAYETYIEYLVVKGKNNLSTLCVGAIFPANTHSLDVGRSLLTSAV